MKTPWIRVHGQSSGLPDNKVRIRCVRCSVVLVVPGDTPTERVSELIIGFEVDHAECEGAPKT